MTVLLPMYSKTARVAPSPATTIATVFGVTVDPVARQVLMSIAQANGWRLEFFSSTQAFLTVARKEAVGCVVFDASSLNIPYVELHRLIADSIALPILFINGQTDVRAAVCAIKAGAFDFLPQAADETALWHIVDEAIELSRAQSNQQERLQSLRSLYTTLSRREQEVMVLVTSGLLNKQVGGRLGISEITVKAHRGQVMRKMKARSFAELVNMAAALGATERTCDASRRLAIAS